MSKRNRMKILAGFSFGFFLIAMLTVSSLYFSRQWEESHCGVPDAVSSSSDGSRCRLTVVANCDSISDREEFAREVIKMCRSNSFQSLKLSTDISGWPNSLDIAVYLHKKDIGGDGPVMRIRYEPAGDEPTYDIKNNADQYTLTIE